MLNRKWLATSAALLLALFLFVPRAHAQGWDCGVLPDCGFDDFYGDSGVNSGVWKTFTLSDTHPRFSLSQSEGGKVAPSLWIQNSANDAFDGGVYQRVAVEPGKGYTMMLWFAVVAIGGVGCHDCPGVNRRVGIDPYGGTDPNSGDVHWSNDFFGKGRFEEDQIQVSKYARSATVTVFIRVTNDVTDKHVDVYIDSAALRVNSGMTPIQVDVQPTAAPTQPPAPTLAPPTAKPTLTAKAALAPTNTPEATSTENVESTDTPTTAIAAATAEPSDTPTRARATSTRLARVTPTPIAATTLDVSPLMLGVVGVAGVVGVLGAGGLFALAYVYWQRGRRA